MKKIIATIVALNMVFAMCSCGEKNSESVSETSVSEASEEQTTTSTTATTTTTTTTTTATTQTTTTQTTAPITTQHVHDTHSGKCSGCGEYVLDKLYIPGCDDFVAYFTYQDIPETVEKYNFEQSTDGFFVNVRPTPDKQLLDDCEDFSGQILLKYVGDLDMNIITDYEIEYVPKNQAELDKIKDALCEEIDGRYGYKRILSESDAWLFEDDGMRLDMAKGGNFISLRIQLAN